MGVREHPETPLAPPLKSVYTEVDIISFQILRHIAMCMYYSSQNFKLLK